MHTSVRHSRTTLQKWFYRLHVKYEVIYSIHTAHFCQRRDCSQREMSQEDVTSRTGRSSGRFLVSLRFRNPVSVHEVFESGRKVGHHPCCT